ncbi:MAG: GNAT family N-acetyltransferase, partial [Planctomycetes bacterium]|nr:GNAT family N-acetyltransferase [Planctomycetota bacterium]
EAAVEAAYGARAAFLGRRVTLLEGNEAREGILESVSPTAGVALREDGGTLRIVRAEHARELRVTGTEPGSLSSPACGPAEAEDPEGGGRGTEPGSLSPPGTVTIRVRPAVPGDAEGIARVQGDGWRAAYRGLLPDEILEAKGREPDAVERRRRWLSEERTFAFVAEKEGEVLGFVLGGRDRDGGSPFEAEVTALYVRPDLLRRRIGWRLMVHAAEAIRAAGWSSMRIWVLEGNSSGRAFYERLGGRLVGEKTGEIGGHRVAEVAYGWATLDRVLIGMEPGSPS